MLICATLTFLCRCATAFFPHSTLSALMVSPYLTKKSNKLDIAKLDIPYKMFNEQRRSSLVSCLFHCTSITFNLILLTFLYYIKQYIIEVILHIDSLIAVLITQTAHWKRLCFCERCNAQWKSCWRPSPFRTCFPDWWVRQNSHSIGFGCIQSPNLEFPSWFSSWTSGQSRILGGSSAPPFNSPPNVF